MELEKTWRVSGLASTATPFRIQVHAGSPPPQANVLLEGGEALSLRYDPQHNRLLYLDYRPIQVDSSDDVRGDPVVVTDPRTSEQFTAQALLPHRSDDDVTFFLYIKNRDPLRFTPRPRHVWAEIQPLTRTETPLGDKYVFYDRDFVSSRPVPVFQWTAQKWPQLATKAAISVWFQTADVRPGLTHVVNSAEEKTLTVPGLRGVEFRVEPQPYKQNGLRVVVTEIHHTDALDTAVSVQLEPPPDGTLHRHYLGVGTTRHTFDYENRLRPKLHITSREDMLERAVRVPSRVVLIQD